MPRDKVFVSYSHTEKAFLDELLPVLQAVPRIASNLWFDEQKIDIGDRFHPEIQQGLAASRVGILLLSNRFFTSEYIRQYELPYLLQQVEQKALRLASLYVTAIPNDAFRFLLKSTASSVPSTCRHTLVCIIPESHSILSIGANGTRFMRDSSTG